MTRESDFVDTSDYVTYKEIVSHPGKFEGCLPYVPYFWEQDPNSIQYQGDEAASHFVYEVEPRDKELFPELEKRKFVVLYEDDQGFVREI